MTFVAAVNNEQILQTTLLRSPCLQGNHVHQIILTRGASSAAQVYNDGLKQAKHDLVVFVHQDVYLPDDWPEIFQSRYVEAENKFGHIGVAGVYGVGTERYGHIFHRGLPLMEPGILPARVRTLDELLLALPRRTKLRFDSSLGFHFYGADIAMQAIEAGMSAVVLDAICHHGSAGFPIPAEFGVSRGIFAAKWKKHLPICTSCTEIR